MAMAMSGVVSERDFVSVLANGYNIYLPPRELAKFIAPFLKPNGGFGIDYKAFCRLVLEKSDEALMAGPIDPRRNRTPDARVKPTDRPDSPSVRVYSSQVRAPTRRASCTDTPCVAPPPASFLQAHAHLAHAHIASALLTQPPDPTQLTHWAWWQGREFPHHRGRTGREFVHPRLSASQYPADSHPPRIPTPLRRMHPHHDKP